jgi:hypothetical protein
MKRKNAAFNGLGVRVLQQEHHPKPGRRLRMGKIASGGPFHNPATSLANAINDALDPDKQPSRCKVLTREEIDKLYPGQRRKPGLFCSGPKTCQVGTKS